MTIGLMIEHIRNSWLPLLILVPLISYFIYLYRRDRKELERAKETKKMLEADLAKLEARYAVEVGKLEKKWNESKMSFKGGLR